MFLSLVEDCGLTSSQSDEEYPGEELAEEFSDDEDAGDSSGLSNSKIETVRINQS